MQTLLSKNNSRNKTSSGSSSVYSKSSCKLSSEISFNFLREFIPKFIQEIFRELLRGLPQKLQQECLRNSTRNSTRSSTWDFSMDCIWSNPGCPLIFFSGKSAFSFFQSSTTYVCSWFSTAVFFGKVMCMRTFSTFLFKFQKKNPQIILTNFCGCIFCKHFASISGENLCRTYS